MSSKKGKVVVAMSGGVDSSVAAALLKEQGYEVIGATMQVYSENGFGDRSVSVPVSDARAVAGLLEIPHYTFDLRKEFENRVVNPFVCEYLGGRTPNPCVICNKRIKFGIFLQKAVELGADYLATGHYSRIRYQSESGRFLLLRGCDKSKDQTYMLYGLKQEQLAKTLMPLGSYEKGEIRKLAAGLNLPVAEKAESQEICFIQDDDYRRFISMRVGDEIKPGPIFDTSGKEIGRHKGLPYYTIGQRKGLGLALGYPAYVVDLDKEKNAVVIGSREETLAREFVVEDNNFIPFDSLRGSVKADVKVRYKSKEVPALLKPLDCEDQAKVVVELEDQQHAITPGQAAVYYKGSMVLGGGTIHNVS